MMAWVVGSVDTMQKRCPYSRYYSNGGQKTNVVEFTPLSEVEPHSVDDRVIHKNWGDVLSLHTLGLPKKELLYLH